MNGVQMGSNDSRNWAAESWVSDNFRRSCFDATNIKRNEYSNDCVGCGKEVLLELNIQNGGGVVISSHQCWAAAW